MNKKRDLLIILTCALTIFALFSFIIISTFLDFKPKQDIQFSLTSTLSFPFYGDLILITNNPDDFDYNEKLLIANKTSLWIRDMINDHLDISPDEKIHFDRVLFLQSIIIDELQKDV